MVDTGLSCLVKAAQYFGIPADLRQMERAYIFDKGSLGAVEMLRAAKDLKLKARLFEQVSPERFLRMTFPAAALLKNGRYVLVLQTNERQVRLIDPAASDDALIVDAAVFFDNWAGDLILFTKRYELAGKFRAFGLGWFFPIIAQYKRFFLQVLGISLLLQLLGLAAPLFTQVIIDKVLVHRSLHTLDVMLIGMILVALFENWLTALRTYLFMHTTNKVDVVLSSRMFQAIMALPVKYFEKWQVGDVVSRARELETIRNFITGSGLTLVLDIVFTVVYLVVMVVYSPMLSLIVAVTAPLFILLNLVAAPIYKRLINERFLIGAENQSFLIETITGVRTVKAMGVERQFVKRYEEMLARYIKAVFSVANLANVAGNIGLLLQQCFNLAILWIGAYAVIDGDITVGELIAFQMLASQVITPILRLVNMWQYFQQTRVSLERLGDIMNEPGEPAFNPNRTTLPGLRGEVVLDKVSFRYAPDGGDVLRDVSLRIPAGMKIGIVGRSGSGKSTLTKLVQRLYVPDSGRVLVDGVDLAQVEPAWLRRQIGVVLQDSFLFGGTIKENIAIACPHATDEAIFNAAKMAGADVFIQEMPHGYDTFVGERGSLLSGGQKQRISIARALLSDPSILVFDEATSALDYESEKIIMDHLDLMAKDRTMIMIAHRLSTVKSCQVILVMDRGAIVEAGAHQALMERRGTYYHLYTQQA